MFLTKPIRQLFQIPINDSVTSNCFSHQLASTSNLSNTFQRYLLNLQYEGSKFYGFAVNGPRESAIDARELSKPALVKFPTVQGVIQVCDFHIFLKILLLKAHGF